MESSTCGGNSKLAPRWSLVYEFFHLDMILFLSSPTVAKSSVLMASSKVDFCGSAALSKNKEMDCICVNMRDLVSIMLCRHVCAMNKRSLVRELGDEALLF